MKTTRFLIFVLAVCVALPATTFSIPAFARKYGFNCNMCHTAFTKLSDFGQRFRNDGYQMPGQEGLEKNVFETSPPIAFRTSFGLVSSHSKNSNTTGFNVQSLDLLSAGVLHKNIGFLVVYTPRIDNPPGTFTGSADGSNPSQVGALESANLVFSNLVKDALDLRVGRFEPGYQPFSAKRSFYAQQPYEVYAFAAPANNFALEDNQMGVEVTGDLRNGLRYAGGVVNGSGARPDNSRAKDLYVRLAQVVGRGEGQSAGQRFGVFGYFGWQPTLPGDTNLGPTGETNGKANKPFRRIGGDVSLNWQMLNLHGLFMQGEDDKALSRSGQNYKFTGGFVQLDYAGLIDNRLISSLLYNWVTPPSSDKERQVSAISVLLRYYVGDWTAVNIALHGEYTHREVGKLSKVKTDNVALLTDFAF